MKVFISWSGEQSREIGLEFKNWIPAVIQAVKPYFSSSDIDKGSRWASEISKELEQSRVGLICLTRENLEAPWIMFEAGALSKSIENSKVCPMLFGLETTDLTGPLVQFQATVFNKAEVRKLMESINSELGDNGLAKDVLDSVFDKWWPELEDKITKIINKKDSNKAQNVRTERDLLEEILSLTRLLHRDNELEDLKFTRPSNYDESIEGLLGSFTELSFFAIGKLNADTSDFLLRLLSMCNSFERLIKRQVPSGKGIKMLHNLRTIKEKLESEIELIGDIPF